MFRSSPQPVSLHEECALFRLSRAVSFRFDPLRFSDFFRSPDRFAGRCPEDQTASISRRSSDFLPDSRSFGLFPDFRHLPLSPDIIHRNKKTAPFLACSLPRNPGSHSAEPLKDLRNKYFVNIKDSKTISTPDFLSEPLCFGSDFSSQKEKKTWKKEIGKCCPAFRSFSHVKNQLLFLPGGKICAKLTMYFFVHACSRAGIDNEIFISSIVSPSSSGEKTKSLRPAPEISAVHRLPPRLFSISPV